MNIKTYFEQFDSTDINQDTHEWKQGYFLMIDDEQTEDTQLLSTDHNCPGCTRHILKVKNEGDDEQFVFVGAHVWNERSYGWFKSDVRDCSVATHGRDRKSHFFFKSVNGESNRV